MRIPVLWASRIFEALRVLCLLRAFRAFSALMLFMVFRVFGVFRILGFSGNMVSGHLLYLLFL